MAELAPLVAEGHAAVHAAGRLILQHRCVVRQIHFPPVVDALVHGPRRLLHALDLDEAAGLTHLPAPRVG